MMVSIHLMLLFIIFAFRPSSDCCIVSIHLMLLFIGSILSSFVWDSMFQYISCYSLSGDCGPVLAGNLCLFQYISCYSLSSCRSAKRVEKLCFNTSHVTLYLFAFRPSSDCCIVSIHLMLLFIAICDWNGYKTVGFQYISCYSLSISLLHVSKRMGHVSIHLMLLFINY